MCRPTIPTTNNKDTITPPPPVRQTNRKQRRRSMSCPELCPTNAKATAAAVMRHSSNEQPTRRQHRRRSSVSFGTVQVREFERIAGDNPAVPQGPSLSLGWGYVEGETQSVKRYERTRERASVFTPLNAETRHFILYHIFDISSEELEASEKSIKRVKKQRQRTLSKMNIKRKTNKVSPPPPETDEKESTSTSNSSNPVVEDPPMRKASATKKTHSVKKAQMKPLALKRLIPSRTSSRQ